MPGSDLDRSTSKKAKKKSGKKFKKHKKEKRREEKNNRHDFDRCSLKESSGEQTCSTRTARNEANNMEDLKTFGPALPPHLLNPSSLPKVIIGPQMPSNRTTTSPSKTILKKSDRRGSSSAEDEDMVFGPVPLNGDHGEIPLSIPHLELEQRALELKIAAFGDSEKQSADLKVREEWMIELPEVGLKGGLAALSNMKRKFHHGKERPDFSDRSVWTNTPQSDTTLSLKPLSSKATSEALRTDAQAIRERQHDKEQELVAKKHKRNESLVEIHQKKLQQEQKKKEELDAAKGKSERRPFSREIDLKLNKIDKNQTKSIVDKAKVLNTKFASGNTKYL